MLASLIVGLGGTGSWTLAHLKQRLLTDHRFVLLGRGLDEITKPQYDQYVGPIELRALDVDRKNRPAIVGGIMLDSSVEDLNLGGAIGRTIEDIQKAEPSEASKTWPTIQRWLPREDALKYSIDDAIQFMTEGAGQIRQFGRIAFFLELLNGAPELGRLTAPLTRLAQGNDLQIIVVASVAGGTGAGMLVDTLAYLQHFRRQTVHQVQIRTVAFVVLPGAFAGGAINKQGAIEAMQANGRAALREIDRLINAPGTVEIEWLPGRNVRLENPATDICYLLDGSRDIGQEAPKLEGHVPYENGLPAAIADAVYVHVFPSTGAVLGRDYPNLVGQLIGGSEARYSSFGCYSITYAWEPLTRSLSLRASVDILDHLLSGAEEFGRSRLPDFLSTGATAALSAGMAQQEIPIFAVEGLGQVRDATSLVIPGTAWLTPRLKVAPSPSTPNLFDSFPGLGRMRTEYENPDVVAQSERIIDEFWGAAAAIWNGQGSAGFHEASNHNMAQAQREWERALHIAVVALMNGNDKVGGLSAARAFLLSLIARIEEFARQLAAMPQIDLTPYRQAVVVAENEMNDARHWDDAKEQRDYLDARQDLLEQEISDNVRRRVSDLTGRFLGSAQAVLSVVDGWRTGLEILRDQAVERRSTLDTARSTAAASPVQRYLPLPNDGLEESLWQESYGRSADGMPAGLRTCLDALDWDVDEEDGHGPEIVFTFPGRERHKEVMKLEAVMSVALHAFTSLRTKSVWEMLERNGETEADIVSELVSRGARFSVFDPNGQQDVEGNLRQVRDWNYVFASWLEDRQQSQGGRDANSIPGGALSRAVRDRLRTQEIQTEDLTAFSNTGRLPTDDKLIAFSARHLIALDAFPAVSILESAYERQRENIPSPHTLPEELGAARLEAKSIQLAQAGHLSREVRRIHPGQILLCGDQRFIQYVAACVAGNRLHWEEHDPIRRTGSWILKDESTAIDIGTSPDLTLTLTRILTVSDHESRQARTAIEKVGADVARAADGRQALTNFARSAASGDVDLSPELLQLLQIGAALTIA